MNPRAIAQSSILGGWIHNDEDRFDFLIKVLPGIHGLYDQAETFDVPLMSNQSLQA